MSWDQRQRDLEERLRNVRVRDDDVLKKLEMVLENQKNQNKLEQKMDEMWEKLQSQGQIEQQNAEIMTRLDQMNGKLETLAVQIHENDDERTRENKDILDVVETNLGWLEFLAEENEKFEDKMEEMKKTISSNLDSAKREILQEIYKMIGEGDRKFRSITDTIGDLKGQCNQLQEDIQKKMDHISQYLTKLKEENDNTESTLNRLDVEFEDSVRGIRQAIAVIETRVAFMIDPNFRCQDTKCNFKFSKDLILRDDGVTSDCPKCKYTNIVGKLKKDNKWMRVSGCCHFQQLHIHFERLDKVNCPICGNKGYLYETNLKCQIKTCNASIPKDVHFREDGVTLICPQCKCLNIVGKLETGQKLMNINGCDHFICVSMDRKEGELELCELCGDKGRIEPVLRCCDCWCVLPNNLPLRKDGVSVECPNVHCGLSSIVGKLTEEHKWMHDVSLHFQQAPRDDASIKKEKCNTCGQDTDFFNADVWMALQF